MLHPVLLCGGSGERLWPLSRRQYPKQFLALNGDGSLLQATAGRVEGLEGLAAPIAVANSDYRFLVAEQLCSAGVPAPVVLLEPAARNTAPAVAGAAMVAPQPDADAVVLVMPSGHVIVDEAAFRQAVAVGQQAAEEGRLATFGVHPTHAETGYGYIRALGDGAVRPVAEFIEKPVREAAEGYLAAGGCFWNSGIFLFGARRYLEELKRFRPDILEAVERSFSQARSDLDFLRLDAEAFEACPNESIDYAVMEHTRDAMVVPVDFGWSDVGSWTSLRDIGTPDADGNVLCGDVIAEDTSGCYVRSEGRLVAALGIRDQVIVETPDAVLVGSCDRVQDVKRIVARLKRGGRSETETHRRVSRPWGAYEGIAQESRFQVKRIIVSPGQRLSLQMHHHRAEHWIVVSGTAKVTRGDNTFLLTEDQSTYIPLGTSHRLENPGVIPLELIEVQTGSYLGEDDIVRFDDVYGRAEPSAEKISERER